MFASRGRGIVEGDREARDTMVITRATSERLFDFAFDLAATRKKRGLPGKVTCVDKSNVFRAFAFFRKVFDERAAKHPGCGAAHHYIDAAALDLVRRPWEFDVMVTENLFGDILSDLGAGLIGGMGFAPSGDVGVAHAVFQPSHGSAPDIAGTGKANPTGMILSAALMLDWLGRQHQHECAIEAAKLLKTAVDRAFEKGLRSYDIGGRAGTSDVARAVIAELA
jgi:3-isopropylmalate dehydrogenase